MDRNRTVTESNSTARHASEATPQPFSDSGDGDGTVPARCGDESGEQANGAEAERTPQGEAECATATLATPCRCGAPPHATEVGICARGHAMPGNQRSLKHGQFAQQPPIDADGAVMASLSDYRYDALCRNFFALEQQTLRFAEGMQARPGRVKDRDLKALHGMSESLRTYHADLQAMESSMTQEQLWAKVARVFSRRADDFIELVCDVLQRHPEFAPTLRAALAAHDGLPQQPEVAPAVPLMQVPSDDKPRSVVDEPDEMDL